MNKKWVKFFTVLFFFSALYFLGFGIFIFVLNNHQTQMNFSLLNVLTIMVAFGVVTSFPILTITFFKDTLYNNQNEIDEYKRDLTNARVGYERKLAELEKILIEKSSEKK